MNGTRTGNLLIAISIHTLLRTVWMAKAENPVVVFCYTFDIITSPWITVISSTREHKRKKRRSNKTQCIVCFTGIFSVLREKKRYQLGDENEKKGWTNVLDSPVCWITSDNGNWNFFPSFLYFSIPAQQLIELSDKILTRSLFLLSVLFLPFFALIWHCWLSFFTCYAYSYSIQLEFTRWIWYFCEMSCKDSSKCPAGSNLMTAWASDVMCLWNCIKKTSNLTMWKYWSCNIEACRTSNPTTHVQTGRRRFWLWKIAPAQISEFLVQFERLRTLTKFPIKDFRRFFSTFFASHQSPHRHRRSARRDMWNCTMAKAWKKSGSKLIHQTTHHSVACKLSLTRHRRAHTRAGIFNLPNLHRIRCCHCCYCVALSTDGKNGIFNWQKKNIWP